MTGSSLHSLDDPTLLQLILRTDLPRFLIDVYNAEVDRRIAEQDQHAVTVITTMNLPYSQGDGK